MSPAVLNINELSALLRCHRATIYRWCKDPQWLAASGAFILGGRMAWTADVVERLQRAYPAGVERQIVNRTNQGTKGE